jgi:hypothetical protein
LNDNGRYTIAHCQLHSTAVARTRKIPRRTTRNCGGRAELYLPDTIGAKKTADMHTRQQENMQSRLSCADEETSRRGAETKRGADCQERTSKNRKRRQMKEKNRITDKNLTSMRRPCTEFQRRIPSDARVSSCPATRTRQKGREGGVPCGGQGCVGGLLRRPGPAES